MPERIPQRGPVRRGGAGRAVLVVDSVSIARKFLVQRLAALGYDAHAAEDGERAMAALQARPFGIVFRGLELSGGIDGLSLCVAVKQTPPAPGAKVPAVVITTGEAGSMARVRGTLARCDAYLNKPLIEADLVAALGEVDPLFN